MYASSNGGALVYYGQNLLMHYSRTQTVIATSTFEAEIYELTRATKEILTTMGILKDLGLIGKHHRGLMMTDANIVLDALEAEIVKRRTKHLSIEVAFLKEKNEKKLLNYGKVPGEINTADIMTKTLTHLT